MSSLYRISFILCLAFASIVEAKVNIFAHYFGQPEFVKYQYLFFKKNMLDDYELVVFEDSFEPAISKQIQQECEKYGIRYVHIPKEVFEKPKFPVASSYVDISAPSFGCSVATQYIYDNYVVPSKDVCMILDNDIFLLSPFSIENYVGQTPFVYSEETRSNKSAHVYYMLPNFVIFNPSLMPQKERLSFNLGTILGNNTDSGGFTYFYLLDHRNLGKKIDKYYLYDTTSPLKEKYQFYFPLLFNSKEWSSHYFIDKELFLHIRMGSNWSKHGKYMQIRREIESFFDILLRN